MIEKETDWELYASNDEMWLAMLADCAKAEKSIVLEQFIFVYDDFSQKLINICAERAKAGVEVRFLWDAAGSFTFFGTGITEDLRSKGIQVLFWKTLIPSYFKVPDIRSWYLRNHRRTIVIDDRVGYTGSICVSDSMKNWRDTNVRLEGPVVKEMSSAFDRMWDKAQEKRVPPQKAPRSPGDSKRQRFAYILNSPSPGKRFLYREILEAIREARRYIYITTPYFVPTSRLLRAIKRASHRGVDIRIIIPERSDHYPALDLAARSYFTSLFMSGIRIFLYPNNDGNIIHSKAIVIDDRWSTVGSLNLDNASLLYNFEANIVSTDARFAEELAAHFVRDMSQSEEVKASEWHSRFFLEKIPEFLIKLVRKFL